MAPKNLRVVMMLGRCFTSQSNSPKGLVVLCGDVGVTLLTVEAAKGNQFDHSVS